MLDIGPPAFAQTLRVFKAHRMVRLVDLISPHCRDLQVIGVECYHDIIANNPKLTALSLWPEHSRRHPTGIPIDLAQHHCLTKLTLFGDALFSEGTLPHVECVSLREANPDHSSQLLAQCPALKRASIACKEWSDIAKITSVLNPQKCTQLTLEITDPKSSVTFREVESVILKRGFQIMNEEFLLWTKDAKAHWKQVTENLIPQSKNREVLKLKGLAASNPMLVSYSFPTLSSLHLSSALPWNEGMLQTVMKGCPMLKDFGLTTPQFSGTFAIESQVLCKLSLDVDEKEVQSINLKLPNLTQLSLHLICGGGTFLQKLLDGDPSLQLPLLRVLSISMSLFQRHTGMATCKVGHRSLAQLIMNGGLYNDLELSTLTLQNLPCLKQAYLIGCSSVMNFVLDLPGDCDLFLACSTTSGPMIYSRQGYSDSLNFRKKLRADSQRRWVEEEDVVEQQDSKRKREG